MTFKHTIDYKPLGSSPDSSTLSFYLSARGNTLEELREDVTVSEVDQEGEEKRTYGYPDVPAFLEDAVDRALDAVMRRVA